MTGNSRNQVRLELVEIDIQRAIETEGCSNRGNDLGNEPVKVWEARGGDIKPLLADVVNSFIVHLSIS